MLQDFSNSPGLSFVIMATTEEHLTVAPIVGPDDPRRFTDSGIEIAELYTEADLPESSSWASPASSPTRAGSIARCTASRPGRCASTPGYASAKESNERYRYLLSKGSTGLSMAFDLPTQLGLDSDNPRCLGEVGRTGVAIDTIDDMRTAFDGIPLDQVSTSMTINAPAACLLLLYELVGEEQGVPAEKLRGTTQNDVLKEYIARGNYIYPPAPTMRLTTDLFEYCHERVPALEHDLDLRLPLPREGLLGRAGGRVHALLRHRLRAGGDRQGLWTSTTSRRGWRSSSTATTTSSRRSPSSAPPGACGRTSCASASAPPTRRQRCCASTPRPAASRSPPSSRRTTSCGSRCKASRPSAAAPSRCTPTASTRRSRCRPSGRPRSHCAPSRSSPTSPARPTPSTRSPAPTSSRPSPTRSKCARNELIEKVDALGGSVNAIEFITGEIDESAWGYQERYRIGQDIVVGVNAYQEDDIEVPDLLRVDPESEREQVERLKSFKADRDHALVERRLEELREVARGSENLLPGDPPGAQGPLLARRGLRRDAGRLRPLHADVLILTRGG